MDKVLVTVFLLIAGIVCSVAVFNAVYPAINRSSAAITTMSGRIDDRIKSQIEIIETAKQDSNVYIWVKNVGSSRILETDKCDVFFGPVGEFSRVPYGTGSLYWDYVIESDNAQWDITATIKLTIHHESAPASGTYFVKIVLPNGISDEHQFSI